MNNKILYLLAFTLLSATQQTFYAATVVDSLKTTLNTTPQDTVVAPAKQFNAINYSVQKRYMAHRCQFPQARSFWDNTYLSLGTKIEGLTYREGAEMERNYLVELTGGKEFTPYHSARLSLYGGSAKSKANTNTFFRTGLRAAYLFNPTAYIWGYDPYRRIEGLVTAGMGCGITAYNGQSTFMANLDLGVQFKLHLQKQLNLYIEPSFSFYTDGVDAHTLGNWHKYDFGYGLSVGLNYYIQDPMRATTGKYAHREKEMLDGFFIALGGGMQFQISNETKEIGVFSTAREHFQFSIGKWIIPSVGIRFTPFYGKNVWNRHYKYEGADTYQTLYSCNYGARLEAMLDVVQLIRPREEGRRFTLIALAGLEYGGIRKDDVYTNLHDLYAGFTAGLQFKVHVAKGYSIFLEPGYSFVPYTYIPLHYDGSYLERMSFFDNNIRLNIGLEYDFSYFFHHLRK